MKVNGYLDFRKNGVIIVDGQRVKKGTETAEILEAIGQALVKKGAATDVFVQGNQGAESSHFRGIVGLTDA